MTVGTALLSTAAIAVVMILLGTKIRQSTASSIMAIIGMCFLLSFLGLAWYTWDESQTAQLANSIVFLQILMRELKRLAPGLTEAQYQEMARLAIRQAADLAQKSGMAAVLVITSCAAWLLIRWGAPLGGSPGSLPSNGKIGLKAAEAAAAGKFCINCGASLRTTDTFCTRCGSKQ